MAYASPEFTAHHLKQATLKSSAQDAAQHAQCRVVVVVAQPAEVADANVGLINIAFLDDENAALRTPLNLGKGWDRLLLGRPAGEGFLDAGLHVFA